MSLGLTPSPAIPLTVEGTPDPGAPRPRGPLRSRDELRVLRARPSAVCTRGTQVLVAPHLDFKLHLTVFPRLAHVLSAHPRASVRPSLTGKWWPHLGSVTSFRPSEHGQDQPSRPSPTGAQRSRVRSLPGCSEHCQAFLSVVKPLAPRPSPAPHPQASHTLPSDLCPLCWNLIHVSVNPGRAQQLGPLGTRLPERERRGLSRTHPRGCALNAHPAGASGPGARLREELALPAGGAQRSADGAAMVRGAPILSAKRAPRAAG